MGQGNRQIISYLSLLGEDRDTPKWYITRMSSQIYPSSSEHLGFVSESRSNPEQLILVDGQVFRIINFLTGILPFAMFFTHFRPFLWQNTTHHKSLPLRLQPTMTGWLASLEWKTQSLAMLCSLGLQHSGGRQGTLSLGFSDDGMTGSMKNWANDHVMS